MSERLLDYESIAMSVDEFLRREQRSEIRHEYVDGHAYPMTATTARHSQICGNLLMALHPRATGEPCSVYLNTVLVRAAEEKLYYPDASVVCRPIPPTTLVL